jgi:hypothetical protein
MPRATSPARSSRADTAEAVDAFLATLAHPHLAEIQRLRRLVTDAHASIAEGIKWNAPSFRTREYFATFHLRQPRGVALILHLGARRRDPSLDGSKIEDPEALLRWLGQNRAIVAFADAEQIEARAAAFQTLIRHWIDFV